MQSETDVTWTHYFPLFPKYNHSLTGDIRAINPSLSSHSITLPTEPWQPSRKPARAAGRPQQCILIISTGGLNDDIFIWKITGEGRRSWVNLSICVIVFSGNGNGCLSEPAWQVQLTRLTPMFMLIWIQVLIKEPLDIWVTSLWLRIFCCLKVAVTQDCPGMTLWG